MAAPILSSITPTTGAPGTEITLTGSGFTASCEVSCPWLVDTEYVSATELKATIPGNLVGPAGGSLQVGVFVRAGDGLTSSATLFTVLFSQDRQQSYTTVDAVASEVPGFQRGGHIGDSTIESWMRSVAQSINGVLLSRGLPLDPTEWQQADSGNAMPAPSGVLENINRIGAASRLAAAVGGEFGSGEWGLAKSIREAFAEEMTTLRRGGYDKLFKPAAATEITGQQVSGGDIETDDGEVEHAFTKTQEF